VVGRERVFTRDRMNRPFQANPAARSERMFRKLALVGVALLLCACQRTPSEVMQKVKYDFGVGEKPEG